MAHFYRLILAALLAAFSLASHALIPVVPGWSWGGSPPAIYSDPLAACKGRPGPGQYVTAVAGPPSAITGSSADADCIDGRDGARLFVVSKVGTICPVNSEVSGGQCQCVDGFVENAGKTACEPKKSDCELLAGKSAGNRRWDAGAGFNNRSSAPHYYCDGWNPAGGGKCVAVAGNGDAVWTFEDGHWWGTGAAVYTGATASTCDGIGGDGNTPAPSTPKTPDGTPPKNPDPGTSAPSPCPTGQAAGEVNGSRVCAPTGSDTPKAAHESGTKKNPDGSTTTTDQDTRCNGVKCETDTRVCKTGTDGLQTCETTTTSSEQSGFCNKSENKGNKVCTGQGEGTPSGFGGNCDAGFIAKGDDAVLNAMAQEQYKRNCELLRTDKEPSTWLSAEGQRTGDRTGDNPNNGTVAIGPGNFDTSNALGGGGGSCNLNKTVTVRGYSVALPFNVLCDPLAVLGQILVAVSMLLAARIVTRG